LIPIFNITYDSSNKITVKDSEISGWECLTDADGGISNSGVSIAGGMRSVISMGGGVLGSCQYILSSSLDSLWSGSGTSLTQCTNDNAGNATWTSVSPGSSSTGTCNSGYIMVNTSKMSRSCTNSNGAATLEAVGSNGATSSGNFAGCTIAQCTNDNAGNATWTTVNAGSSSTGTCKSGYTANNSSKMSRLCSISNNAASLETVTGGVTASGNFAGCASAAPIAYNGGSSAAHDWSYYRSSMFSSTNLSGLNAYDLGYINDINGLAWWFWITSFLLPSSAGTQGPIDWFIANPNVRIIDYCTTNSYNTSSGYGIHSTQGGSPCYGSTTNGALITY